MNVLVTGPESSGTRFVSRWLEAHDGVTARHWSMPSGAGWARHWPTDHDYDGEPPDAAVVVVRSFDATVASQLERRMTSGRAESEANVVQGLMRALTWCVSHGIRTRWVLYDSIVADPSRFADVAAWLGVEPTPFPGEVIDANAKWEGR